MVVAAKGHGAGRHTHLPLSQRPAQPLPGPRRGMVGRQHVQRVAGVARTHERAQSPTPPGQGLGLAGSQHQVVYGASAAARLHRLGGAALELNRQRPAALTVRGCDEQACTHTGRCVCLCISPRWLCAARVAPPPPFSVTESRRWHGGPGTGSCRTRVPACNMVTLIIWAALLSHRPARAARGGRQCGPPGPWTRQPTPLHLCSSPGVVAACTQSHTTCPLGGRGATAQRGHPCSSLLRQPSRRPTRSSAVLQQQACRPGWR